MPAYNEAERIPLTLFDLDKKLSEANFSYEIVVVNDGSKDKTAEIVEKWPRLSRTSCSLITKRTKGRAV